MMSSYQLNRGKETQQETTATQSSAVAAYVECAIWAGHDWTVEGDNPESLDEHYSADDLAPETLAEITGEVADFLAANADDCRGLDPEQIGHDFYLTRNGHGAGFWDRGLGDIGDRLTTAANVYGTSELYPGDDGKLYLSH